MSRPANAQVNGPTSGDQWKLAFFKSQVGGLYFGVNCEAM